MDISQVSKAVDFINIERNALMEGRRSKRWPSYMKEDIAI